MKMGADAKRCDVRPEITWVELGGWILYTSTPIFQIDTMSTTIDHLLDTLSGYHDNQQPFNHTSSLEVFSFFQHTSQDIQNRFYQHHTSSFVMDIYHRWIEQSWKERKYLEDAFDLFNQTQSFAPELLERTTNLPTTMLQCAQSMQLWRQQTQDMINEMRACEEGLVISMNMPNAADDLKQKAQGDIAVLGAMLQNLQEEMEVLVNITPSLERDCRWVGEHLARVWRQWVDDRQLQDQAMALQNHIAIIDQAQEVMMPAPLHRAPGRRRAA